MNDTSSSPESLPLPKDTPEGQMKITDFYLVDNNPKGKQAKKSDEDFKNSHSKRQKHNDRHDTEAKDKNGHKRDPRDEKEKRAKKTEKSETSLMSSDTLKRLSIEDQSKRTAESITSTKGSEKQNGTKIDKKEASTEKYTRTSVNKRRRLSSDLSSDSDGDRKEGISCWQRMKHTNLEFYRNKIRSEPDGDFIENILNTWKEDYEKLERHHGYIQWLFPIKEDGMNSRARVLTDEEAKAIREDPVTKDRVLRSYKMMLGFYGLILKDDTRGTIGPSSKSVERLKHLNSSFHNNLRITRILKSLGEFDYEHFKKPLVTFLMEKAFQGNTLSNCRRSCMNFWIPTITDEKDRQTLERQVSDFDKRGTSRKTRSHRQ